MYLKIYFLYNFQFSKRIQHNSNIVYCMFLLLFICDGKVSFLVTRPFCIILFSSFLLDSKLNLDQVSRNETFLFVQPIIILQIIGDRHIKVHPIAYLGIYCLYWFQYSINFFIYAARCEQYRKAYKYFLIHVNIQFIYNF